jgi:hypothetical protein
MSRKQVDPRNPGPSSGTPGAPGTGLKVTNLSGVPLFVAARWGAGWATVVVCPACSASIDLGPVGWDDMPTCERAEGHDGEHATSHPAGGDNVDALLAASGWVRVRVLAEAEGGAS